VGSADVFNLSNVQSTAIFLLVWLIVDVGAILRFLDNQGDKRTYAAVVAMASSAIVAISVIRILIMLNRGK